MVTYLRKDNITIDAGYLSAGNIDTTKIPVGTEMLLRTTFFQSALESCYRWKFPYLKLVCTNPVRLLLRQDKAFFLHLEAFAFQERSECIP